MENKLEILRKVIVILGCSLAAVAHIQNASAEVRARTDGEAMKRADAKFRVKVTIADPRQECSPLQGELVSLLMSDGKSGAEAENEIDKILKNVSEYVNWTRAMAGKPYAKAYSDYFFCVFQTNMMLKAP